MNDDTKALRKTNASFEKVLVDAGFAVLVLLKRTNSRGTTYFFGSAITDDDGLVSIVFRRHGIKRNHARLFSGTF